MRRVLIGLLGVALAACGGGTAPASAPPSGGGSASTSASTSASAPPSGTADATPSAAASPDDLSALTDEFDDATTLNAWTRLDGVNGWPDQLRVVNIGQTHPGELYLEPYASTWYAAFRGAMLYKEVAGDFVVTARVWGAGLGGSVPRRSFSLAGLIARAPTRDTPDTWQATAENYVFVTTGTGDRPGSPQIETKTTTDSESVLSLKGGRSGWVDLRIVRVGTSFLMMFRLGDDQAWRISDRFARPDLPETLQVGLIAYTDWEDLLDYHEHPEILNFLQVTDRHPDLAARVDGVRFARPSIPASLVDRDLTDETITREELIAAFGF
ncbi:MAG TPA: hypothetical protein VF013_09530 [Candidatus Limnocylindria bacterium]